MIIVCVMMDFQMSLKDLVMPIGSPIGSLGGGVVS